MGNCLTISEREDENANNNGESPATAAGKTTIKGSVVVVKKSILDFHDVGASILDRIYELFGKKVSLQLITISDHPENGLKGKVGKPAILENWVTSYITTVSTTTNREFNVNFDWEENIGIPGALIIKNNHHSQFFLKSITLLDVPGHNGVPIHFICNSWVYPARRYKHDRIFFANKACLPKDTPPALKQYREQELVNLRGDGKGKLQEWDRVYDYAYYNDLGIPGKSGSGVRQILGGSQEFPYPRRVRTGRKPTKADPNTESRLPMLSLSIYIPSDERFSNIKMSDFLAYAAKSIAQVTRQEIKAVFDKTINEFDSFNDILDIYSKKDHDPKSLSKVSNKQIQICQILKELKRSDGEHFSTFPWPDVVKGEDKSAWRTDEEFGREMLAGVNPVCIRRLLEFPPVSNLDPEVYGNQNSSMSRNEIESRMKGLTIDEAIAENKLFILDHHDALMPYLKRINDNTTTKTYASRTLLLLQDDDTLIPLAIELSLPNPEGEKKGAISRVYTPPKDGDDQIKDSIWQLAKAYAAVNDSGYHQLISHWLNTHAVIEPFVIATNRQLSILHPIYQLLQPHYKDTVQINALARHILISANGVLELTVFPGKYSMEMSAVIYKNWNLMEQGLPADLIKRGMAVQDSDTGLLQLLIKDYPYAVDGLEIWFAIEEYVKAYCEFYYPSDELVESDAEIQSWWEELRTEGHGDLKDKSWWTKMNTRKELVDVCTIVIWVATALHAAVNFGQYPYAGYLPNRPTVSRKFMPEPGTEEYKELEENPDVAFLKTITAQFQTLLGVSLIEMLSRHSSDEVYLGQRDVSGWTENSHPLEAFQIFGEKLIEIEKRIDERNNDPQFKNRNGPVMVPYTLLYPALSDPSKAKGLTGIGVPNSVSI
ncbi:probable linoleate 9S-lipoxygenase 5 isoform X2 [Impatiens glandulifera]|uniref:probable linoleate 9S-lipoxygenase 5 isoform X1 n=1 Tax=Impatiens glandulifera TaxID=253017 RepID=UPI001FB15439|nr:probable linoleate 9S-lipoxygenase 5 isoform X1 [Impatiens glandulifera]XP_047315352.1 probable linoleate 9S-lipoxygenase 5 isoform X2 [Impatiens glandulifera]